MTDDNLLRPISIGGMRGLLALLATLVGLLPFRASASTSQQMIELRAADGRSVPAWVIYPDGGPDTGSPVAIIHHGGPGGDPLRALSASRWAAEYFADRGYITISLVSRISRDLLDQPFGAGVADIKGAVDWASQLSQGPIVLMGHSSGSVSNSLYLARTNDPRVKAIVHFAPTAEGRGWMIRNMGKERYDSVVARLRKLIAQGQGDQPIYEDHRIAPPAPQNVTYGYLMSARTWLSWWGPDSINRNLELFPKIHAPTLMISGDADIFVSRAYQEQLRQAATAAARVDSIILDGGVTHEFTGAEAKAAGLAFDWLAGIGIRPSPRVSTRVVDLKLGTDVRPGVIYEPTDAALRKPMSVMLMPDFTDDVMLSPLGAIGPRLARAGYTVLIPQDRGSGWHFYRAIASAVSDDQRAWLKYLEERNHAPVAVVAHGWAGVMVSALTAGSTTAPLAGVALLEPPPAPEKFARSVLGDGAYSKAVAEAEQAKAAGKGGTTMIIARYQTNGRSPPEHNWLTHMATGFLSFWGPSAPAAPIPALRAAGRPVLLIDAGKGRLLSREVEAATATQEGAASFWYEGVTRPFDAPDRLAADLAAWLDKLPR